MASDPLTGLVARALGEPVDAIEVQRLAGGPLAEVDRITWRGPAGGGRLLFRRMHRSASAEAALLPVLARRGAPVEAVLASGIPPRHVAEQRPWVLVREADGSVLCREGAAAVGRAAAALRALHESTRGDLPLLRALGLPELAPATIVEEAVAAAALLEPADAGRLRALAGSLDRDALDATPRTLVHGRFACERVLVAGERLAFLDWSRAHIGSPLEDLGGLLRSLAADASLTGAALERYSPDPVTVASAEALHVLATVRWHAWEGREGIRPLGQCAAAIAAALY